MQKPSDAVRSVDSSSHPPSGLSLKSGCSSVSLLSFRMVSREKADGVVGSGVPTAFSLSPEDIEEAERILRNL